MIERIQNTWSLAKSSWRVLQHDRELIWLPVIGALAALVVFAVFAVPVAGMVGGSSQTVPVAGWILGFVGYVCVTSVIYVARAAVIHGANLRMDGGNPSVAGSLRGASAHWPAVVGFAAIAVTVGLVLDWIRENGGILGAVVSWIGDVAWSVTTYLTLPVIVIEGSGTTQGIRESVGLVKRTWGEQVSANIGFGLLTIAASVPALLVAMVLVPVLGPFAVAPAAIWVLIVWATVSALTAVFQTALYRQATGRSVPGEFDPVELAGSFSRP